MCFVLTCNTSLLCHLFCSRPQPFSTLYLVVSVMLIIIIIVLNEKGEDPVLIVLS